MKFRHLLYRAFYDNDAYIHARRSWEGLGIQYTLFLVAVVVIPLTIAGMFLVRSGFNAKDEGTPIILKHFLYPLADQLPPVKLENHEFTVDAPQPYNIYINDTLANNTVDPMSSVTDPKADPKKHLFAVIDTTGAITNPAESGAVVFINKEGIYVQQDDGGKSDFHAWSSVAQNFSLTAETARKWCDVGYDWIKRNLLILLLFIGTSAALFFGGILFLLRILQTLVFGGVAVLFGKWLSQTVSLQEGIRLAALALTPPVLLNLPLYFIQGHGMSGWLFILLVFGYLIFGIKASKQAAAPNPN